MRNKNNRIEKKLLMLKRLSGLTRLFLGLAIITGIHTFNEGRYLFVIWSLILAVIQIYCLHSIGKMEKEYENIIENRGDRKCQKKYLK